MEDKTFGFGATNSLEAALKTFGFDFDILTIYSDWRRGRGLDLPYNYRSQSGCKIVLLVMASRD